MPPTLTLPSQTLEGEFREGGSGSQNNTLAALPTKKPVLNAKWPYTCFLTLVPKPPDPLYARLPPLCRAPARVVLLLICLTEQRLMHVPQRFIPLPFRALQEVPTPVLPNYEEVLCTKVLPETC